MIRMAQIAPKGIFEDEETYIMIPEEPSYERRFDDFQRNYEDFI